MDAYSFCESVTGIGPRHIRKLGPAGRKLGGGIDTPSLCGLVYPMGQEVPGKTYRGGGGWDIDQSVKLDKHHLAHCCQRCAQKYSLLPPACLECGGVGTISLSAAEATCMDAGTRPCHLCNPGKG